MICMNSELLMFIELLKNLLDGILEQKFFLSFKKKVFGSLILRFDGRRYSNEMFNKRYSPSIGHTIVGLYIVISLIDIFDKIKIMNFFANYENMKYQYKQILQNYHRNTAKIDFSVDK